MIALGLIEALVGLAQSLRLFDPLATYRLEGALTTTGTYMNYNHFAGFLNLGIAITIGALITLLTSASGPLRSEVLGRAWLLVLAGSLMGLGVLVSLSRAGSFTFVMTLVFVSVLVVFRSRRKRLIQE